MTGCILAAGWPTQRGYIMVGKAGRKPVYAHRRALEAKLGRPIAPGLMACHHCDNPPCVNPDHLFEGTASDNRQDMLRKGRWTRRAPERPTCIAGHPFDEANTYRPARGGRHCRACNVRRQLAYRARKAAA